MEDMIFFLVIADEEDFFDLHYLQESLLVLSLLFDNLIHERAHSFLASSLPSGKTAGVNPRWPRSF